MTQFEYLTVLFSFILAIGFGHLLVSIARLLEFRDQLKPDLLHAGAVGLLVLLMVQFWFGFWNFRLVETWTFARILIVILPVASLVIAGLVLIPSDLGPSSRGVPRSVDLREHYFRHRRVFYGLAALTLFFFAIADATISKQPVVHPENLVRTLAIMTCGLAMYSRGLLLHRLLVGGCYVLIGLFLFVSIQR